MPFQIDMDMIPKIKTTRHTSKFQQVLIIQTRNFIKKRPQHRCFLVINVKFKNTYFEKYQRTAASENFSGATILNFKRHFKRNSLCRRSTKQMFLKHLRNSQEITQLESLFNKVADLQREILLKTASRIFFNEFCKNFKNTFFTGHLRTTDSDFQKL